LKALVQKIAASHSEIGWARIFLSYLRQAESPEDQIRLRGMGVIWTSDINPGHAANLLQYFQSLESTRQQRRLPARAALVR
jgi:hypothetical protein